LYQIYGKVYEDRLKAMGYRPRSIGCHGWSWRCGLHPELPEVSTAIVGTTDPEHARRMSIPDRGPLPESIVQEIRKRVSRCGSDGQWLGQT
jgi:hypothetical protein